MFNQLTKHADVPARALLSAIFILAGIGKISTFEGTQAYMEAFGLPGFLLAPTIIFEIGAGLFLLIGFKTRAVATLLVVFAIVSGVIFHADFSDQVQQIMFLKNIAMAGGFLLVAKYAAQGYSVDEYLARRKGV